MRKYHVFIAGEYGVECVPFHHIKEARAFCKKAIEEGDSIIDLIFGERKRWREKE